CAHALRLTIDGFKSMTHNTEARQICRPRTERRFALSLAGLLVAAGFLTACSTSRLLDVTTPNAVPVSVLDEPVNAQLAVASLVSDFQCALGSAIVVEGLIAGEMNDAQLGAAQWDYA